MTTMTIYSTISCQCLGWNRDGETLAELISRTVQFEKLDGADFLEVIETDRRLDPNWVLLPAARRAGQSVFRGAGYGDGSIA
jgi:hypothetical protein